MHVSASVDIVLRHRGTRIRRVCTFGALQWTANFCKKWRGTYFRRGTYLRGFTVVLVSCPQICIVFLLADCDLSWFKHRFPKLSHSAWNSRSCSYSGKPGIVNAKPQHTIAVFCFSTDITPVIVSCCCRCCCYCCCCCCCCSCCCCSIMFWDDCPGRLSSKVQKKKTAIKKRQKTINKEKVRQKKLRRRPKAENSKQRKEDRKMHHSRTEKVRN